MNVCVCVGPKVCRQAGESDKNQWIKALFFKSVKTKAYLTHKLTHFTSDKLLIGELFGHCQTSSTHANLKAIPAAV